jgi:hypothetical protein
VSKYVGVMAETKQNDLFVFDTKPSFLGVYGIPLR